MHVEIVHVNVIDIYKYRTDFRHHKQLRKLTVRFSKFSNKIRKVCFFSFEIVRKVHLNVIYSCKTQTFTHFKDTNLETLLSIF